MSVEDIQNPDSLLIEFLDTAPSDFFYCSKSLTGMTVHWRGLETSICLHYRCAETLALRLIVDARHAELLDGGKPIETGICSALRGS